MFRINPLRLACKAFLLTFPPMAHALFKWFNAYRFTKRPPTSNYIHQGRPLEARCVVVVD
jgi:hypothetical protein